MIIITIIINPKSTIIIILLCRRKLKIDHDSQDMESLTGVVSGIISSAPSLGLVLGVF